MASQDTQSIIKVSLADYRKQIKQLKDELFSLQRGSEDYNKTLEKLRSTQNSYNTILKDIKSPAQAAEGSYNALVQQMAKLRETWKSTSDVVQRASIGKEMNDLNNQLKALDESIGNHQRNVGDYEIATKSLRQQIKENTMELARLQLAGKAGTAEFEALAKETGDLTDAMGDARTAINDYANDVQTLSYGVDIVKSAVSVYSTFTSTLTLFGVEAGNAQEITAKMTTTLTLLNGLQGIQTMLMDKASLTYRAASRIAMAFGLIKQKEVVTTKALSTEVKANTVATEANVIAQKAATAATTATSGALNGLKIALVETGIGALVVGLGMLIAHFKEVYEWLDKATAKLGKTGQLIASIGVPIVGLIRLIGNLIYKTKDASTESEKIQKINERLSKSMDNLKGVYEALGEKTLELKVSYDTIGKAIKKANGDRKEEQRILQIYNKQLGDTAGKYTSFAKLKMDYSTKVKKTIENNLKAEVAAQKSSIAQRKAAEAQYNIDVLTLQKNAAVQAAKERLKIQNASQKDYYENMIKQYEAGYQSALKRGDKSWADTMKHMISEYKTMLNSLPNTVNTPNIDKQLKKWRKTLDENIKLAKQYSAESISLTPLEVSDKPKTNTKTDSSSNKKNDSEILDKLTQKLNQSTNKLNDSLLEVNHTFNMIGDSGSSSIQNQIDNLHEIYILTQQNHEENINLLNSTLQDEKLTAEQRIKIEEKLYSEKYAKIKETFDYEEKINDLRKNLEKSYSDEVVNQSNLRLKANELSTQKQLNLIKNQYDAQIALAKNDEEKEKLESAKQKALNEVNIQSLQNEIEELEKQRLQVQANTAEWINLSLAIEAANQKIYELNQANIEGAGEDKSVLRKRKASYQDWANSTTSLIGSVIDAEKANIDAKVNSGKISEEEAEKQFESLKKQQIALAIIQTISGAVGAYMADTQTYKPAWVGIAMGIVDAATVLAAGYAQVQQIKSTSYGSTTANGGQGGFTGVATAPLLNENLDTNSLQSISTQSSIQNNQDGQRVYILQSDIQKSNKQVQIRENNTTF